LAGFDLLPLGGDIPHAARPARKQKTGDGTVLEVSSGFAAG
jgi:hypothetical protein